MKEEVGQVKIPKLKLKKPHKIALSVVIPILLLLVSGLIYLYTKYPTASPFLTSTYLVESQNHPHAKMSQEIIGFLPYWRMDDTKYLRFDLLSEIIYFSLTVDENGQFVKIVKNETDPGWRWWQGETVKDLIAKTQIEGGKFSLTVAMQKNKTLESFLNNKSAQETLIQNLLTEVKSRHLNGINIDFEYDGIPDDSLRERFVEFNQTLTSVFRKQSPSTRLSIDFFPLSVRKPRMYDIAKLAPLYDRVIIMSYDFYSSSSDMAGPISPIGGYPEKKYIFDINTTLTDYLTIVPKEKLVLGVPYYGWDWTVEDGKTPQSRTIDTDDFPQILSYGRMRTFEDLIENQCQWEPLAQAKWCWYLDPETEVEHQVWMENNQSVEAKYNLIKNQGLAGAAIWTLGYDKQYPDLWQIIQSKFTLP